MNKAHLISEDFKSISEIQKSQRDKVLSVYGTSEEDIMKAEKAKKKKEEDETDDYKHHRMMAGYHSAMADDTTGEALKLSAGSHEEVHGKAKEKSGESQRHKKAADEHRERAKKLYDQEEHGTWDKHTPSKADAIRYGSKQMKEADKQVTGMEEGEDYKGQVEKEEKKKEIKKAEQFDIIEKSKKGPGSKGGKIIGYTKSSKAIYDHNKHESHKHFDKHDHEDATILHASLIPLDYNSELGEHHIKQSNAHNKNLIGIETETVNKSELFEILGVGEDIEKAFSKSEDVMGETSKGKAVFNGGGNNYKHVNFSPEDHHEAAVMHEDRAKTYGEIAQKLDPGVGRIHIQGQQQRHLEHAQTHKVEAQKKFAAQKETV